MISESVLKFILAGARDPVAVKAAVREIDAATKDPYGIAFPRIHGEYEFDVIHNGQIQASAGGIARADVPSIAALLGRMIGRACLPYRVL
jgi:hypothetical protein